MQETIEDKVVEHGSIGFVSIDGGEAIFVDSPEYDAIKDTVVLDSRIKETQMGAYTLDVITKARPQLKRAGDLSPLEKKELDHVIDEEVSVMFFHRQTLVMAGKDITVKQIPAFAEACIESYKKRNPDRAHSNKDFAIVRVNWKTKNIAIQAIE